MLYNREEIEKIKEKYPVGTKVKLIKMDDAQAPCGGSVGIVKGVDDIGSLIIDWNTGSKLHLIIGEDKFDVIEDDNYINELSKNLKIDPVVLKQILAIRDSGKINMLDVLSVQYIANQNHYYELVVFIEEHKEDYIHLILEGK